MHQGQHEVTARRARLLIASQMPDLAAQPLRRVGQSGTDHVLFRLGKSLVARFPRLPHAEAQIDLQAAWLPQLSPLPLPVPMAQRFGLPGQDYPFRWSVLPWMKGLPADIAPLNQARAATTLASFLNALHACRPLSAAPVTIISNQIDQRLAVLEHYIAMFQDEADPHRLRHITADFRKLPRHSGPAVWVHGDLHPLNLLTRYGKLSAVIDWGSMGLGDPAMDLMAAWTLFDAPARSLFRQAMAPANDVWDRARALAFSKSVAAIPYYRTTNPRLRDVMKLTLSRVLQDSLE